MLTYATSFSVGRLVILTWCFPNWEYQFMADNNCKHLFGNLYWQEK